MPRLCALCEEGGLKKRATHMRMFGGCAPVPHWVCKECAEEIDTIGIEFPDRLEADQRSQQMETQA